MVEFALVSIAFLALFFSAVDLTLAVYARLALRNAMIVGTRFAVTGTTLGGMGHDASIKEVMRRNATGMLRTADLSSIQIHYFEPDGDTSATNSAGNLIRISIHNYPVPAVAPLLRPNSMRTYNLATLDIMERFPGAPPAR